MREKYHKLLIIIINTDLLSKSFKFIIDEIILNKNNFIKRKYLNQTPNEIRKAWYPLLQHSLQSQCDFSSVGDEKVFPFTNDSKFSPVYETKGDISQITSSESNFPPAFSIHVLCKRKTLCLAVDGQSLPASSAFFKALNSSSLFTSQTTSFSENGNTSNINFSILIPLGCFGWIWMPFESTYGIFFLAMCNFSWCMKFSAMRRKNFVEKTWLQIFPALNDKLPFSSRFAAFCSEISLYSSTYQIRCFLIFSIKFFCT